MAERYVPGATHIQDLWHRKDGSATARKGRGKRWRAIWVDNLGAQHTQAFDTRVKAKQHLDHVTTALKTHTYVAPEAGRVTVGELLEAHMDAFIGKPKTLGDKRSLVNTQVLPRWGDVPVSAVTATDVRSWMAARMRGDDGGRAVSSKRARDAALLLHSVLKDAVADRRIAFDPMVRVKLPSKGQPRDQYPLNVDQLYQLADAMSTVVDRALLLTLSWTGLRIGEALGLTASAVDLDRRRIHVRRTYAQDAHGRTIVSTPKSHESRWVPLPSQLMGELILLVEARSPGQDIFLGPKGGTINAANWRNRTFIPALEACGLYDADNPRVVHDLRHTFASLAVRAGANIKILQNAMGHKDASITLNTYSHLFDDDLEALGEQLGALGAGGGGSGPVRTHFVPGTAGAVALRSQSETTKPPASL